MRYKTARRDHAVNGHPERVDVIACHGALHGPAFDGRNARHLPAPAIPAHGMGEGFAKFERSCAAADTRPVPAGIGAAA